MKNSNSELIWRGSVHQGDEPGVFGQSSYAGLSFELPITLNSQTSKEQDVSLTIFPMHVKVFAGYPGHKVTITQFVPNTNSPNQFDWMETVLKSDHITNDQPKSITFKVKGAKVYISCRIEIDTTVTPGLYDDFLITGLDFQSKDYQYFASLGFSV